MLRQIPVLTVTDLSKRYPGRKGVQANAGVTLTVEAGQVAGLLGHNGAGKTTLVNQIVGLVQPDSGTINLAGCDAIADPARARGLAAVQVQSNVPLSGLTPRDAISLVGRLRGGRYQAVRQRAEHLIDALDLGPWADQPARKVSGGVARLTAFCMTAIVPTTLHIFDEPTNDVDPVRRRLLWQQIRALADQGTAVLLVTHNVREAESTVDQIVMMDRGKVVAQGQPTDVAARAGCTNLEDAYLALAGQGNSEVTL